MTIRLSKHHGLGNDFLVHLTNEHVDRELWQPRARAWCERHRGIGADGLIVGSPGAGGADLSMALFNADGSVAEISGNGIRCLAQAEARRRGTPRVTLAIATDAGPRACVVHAGEAVGEALVEVGMGQAEAGPEADRDVPVDDELGIVDVHALGLDARDRRTIDLGNPHLVLLVDDPQFVDIAAAGPFHAAAFSGGINVHVMAPTPGRDDAITIASWERGVGVTEACGSGACASAVAANSWGLVGTEVSVEMPGGEAHVCLGAPGAEIILVGPAVLIADIEVER